MSRLTNKVAVVTGGSSGIGLASAKRFQEEGARVVVTGRNNDTLAAARAELGEQALVLQSDASSLSDLDALFATTEEKLGKIDVLFLIAGIAKFEGIDVATEATYDQLFDINVKGPFFAVQKALPRLNDGASIVITTSVANQMGMPGASAYAATKAAVRSFARTFSAELAPRRIRVNAISPGPIETPLFGKLGMPQEQMDEFGKGVTQQVLLGRFGTSEEVASAAAFLASDDSSYVVGEELVVDGGMVQ